MSSTARRGAARLSEVRRRPSSLVSGVTVVALLAGGVGYAVTSADYPITDARLHDYGVWVTNRLDGKVVRFNVQARSLESPIDVQGGAGDFDVLQDDATVLVVDSAQGGLIPVDVVTGTKGTKVALPAGAGVDLRGGTLAVLDAAKGTVSVQATSSAPGGATQGLSGLGKKVVTDLGAGAAMAVGVDGVTHVVSGAGDVLRSARPDGTQPRTRDLTGLTGGKMQVTAVGTQAVVLDSRSGTLLLPDGKTIRLSATGDDVALQWPGPASDSVVVGTATTMLKVSLATGDIDDLQVDGDRSPARPVWSAGCAYGAWNGDLSYATVCGSNVKFAGSFGTAGKAGDELVYRTNRGGVVLNNVRDGHIVRPEMAPLPQQDYNALDQSATTSSDKTGNEEDDRTEKAKESSAKNQRPEPQPDDYGTRKDRPVIVRALENDVDLDGDLLSIEPALKDERGGRATVIENGQAIQVVPDPGKTKVTFRYTVSDPDGATNDAQVTVSVKEPDENHALVARGVTASGTALAGHRVDVDVLRAFRDPENDPLTVRPAAGVTEPGAVRVTARGLLSYTDTGSVKGIRTIPVVVTDGTKEKKTDVTIKVVDGDPPPLLQPDVVFGRANATTTVFPLANDRDLGERPLRISKVPSTDGLDVRVAAGGTRLDITGAKPGSSHLIKYQATNDSTSATAVIRVDTAPTDAPADPVAVGDSVLLSPSGVGEVDLLANDDDPSGKVLVVTRLADIEAAAKSGLRVAVLEHRVLRVWGSLPGRKTVPLRYTLSNGEREAEATVVVSSPEGSGQNQTPSAEGDVVAVQAGDVVDVPVLANDSDPDGDPLTLDPTLAEITGGAVASVRGDVVRVQAPAKPSTVTLVYSVRDASGEVDSAQVAVTVRADPAAQNIAPSPPELTGRAWQGQTVRVPLPPGSLDDDGDSVVVLDIDSPPAKGQVVVENGTTLVYTAFADATGTDTFGYRVVDARGAVASAAVRVGVVPRPVGLSNQDPVAVDDVVTARPARAVAVKVTTNDVDPDGDPLRLAADQAPVAEPAAAGDVQSKGDHLEVTPKADGDFVVPYTVTDGQGGQSSATLSVRARADAPLLAPVARDDVVAADAPETVQVDVLANDEDPDGRTADLTLEPVGAHAAAATVTDRKLSITRGLAAMVVGYSLTDTDGLVGQGFVWVPALSNQPPRLKAPVTVERGTTTSIKLADVVTDPESDPIVAREAKASRGRASVTSPTEIAYIAPSRAGDDTLSVLVEDAPKAGGTAQKVRISIPVGVTAKDSKPEVLSSSLTLTVGDEPRRVPLATLVRERGAAPGARYRFVAKPDVKGAADVTVKGTDLIVTPRAKGAGVVTVTATNASTGRSGKGSITLVVRDSAQVPLVAREFTVVGRTGQSIQLPWKAHVNAGPQAQLEVQPVKLVPSQAGSVEGGGSGNLVFTSARGWTGTAQITYTVLDKASSPQRTLGRAVVVVQDRPAKPGTPEVVTPQSGTSVKLTWAPSDSDGLPVTYTVTRSGGGTQRCPSTICTIRDLPVGTSLTFTVTATNAIGTSDPSTPSTPITINDLPPVPSAPGPVTGLSVEPRDQAVILAFTEPSGVKIARYQYSQNGGQFLGLATDRVVGGLANNGKYTFRIRACSSAECGEASAPSSEVIPFGKPGKPSLSIVKESKTGLDYHLECVEPEPNGRAIDHLEWRVVGGEWTRGCDANFTATQYGSVTYELRAFDTEGKFGDSATETYRQVRPTYSFTMTTECPTEATSGSECTAQIAQLSVTGDLPVGAGTIYPIIMNRGVPDEIDTEHPIDIPELAFPGSQGGTFEIRLPCLCSSPNRQYYGFQIPNNFTGDYVRKVGE